MLEMGGSILIKEPNASVRKNHIYHIMKHYGREGEEGRIRYAAYEEETSPAEISYWASPTPELARRLGNHITLDYLGKDVVAGGFLVVQSDSIYFSATINEYGNPPGVVLTTYFDNYPQSFRVFRRLG